MPRISSIFYENDNPKSFLRHGCCQFLHRTPKEFTGVIPLKYLYNHKDITEGFKQWMNFLNDDLELDIEYSIEDMEFKGWKSLKQAVEVYEKYKDDYFMVSPKDTVYNGVLERTNHSDLQTDKAHIYAGVYSSGSLFATGKPYGRKVSKALHFQKDYPTFTAPTAFVKLPTGLAPEHNNFKYIAWFLVRQYVSYQHFSNFILINRESIEEIMKARNLGWWNILFALMLIFPTSHFGCHTLQKIIKDDLKAAMEEGATYTANARGREKFDYTSDEIYMAGAMHRYCGIKVDADYPRFTEIPSAIVDNKSGLLTSASNTAWLNKLEDYYKYLEKRV